MNPGNSIQNKISTLPELQRRISQWRVLNKKIAFTNGCFDILHAGHIASLTEAARQADYLVVAINADISIKGLKGENRPVNDENSRALVIAALAMVDAVIIFSEPTPRELIVEIRPDVLIKGGDYKVEDIAGAKEVIAWGGKVVLNPIVEGYSTTSIINKLQNK
ncbi:D-glycero-beta-D-manno-heptose 1-phosphate adenylyltransferase [Flavisolibacter ginsengisoli]|uniref:D-glycero-beta-D-manno-heptose 1-phosphate adenylyltransferase n=1 Tax=Flavisolibacter ginsengisoli DSM 18119 TaxID=1121884 RepID=A0A1M4XFS0_9BACT|nr:D-glycero-beta-D-manno-heptose 1-phosphate adenylyltransferase [Flavisolibacter ginsengisoli]SHE92404.1 D-beta-D-heptose 7-phosphate kinase / D-beta-D-heptose 1-phosphate adenosyltransferase [Flavisolibacter ginsengisoli DSM 18119]